MESPVERLLDRVARLEARARALEREVARRDDAIRAATLAAAAAHPAPTSTPALLRFACFSSRPDAGFFRAVGERKLADLGLSESEHTAWASYAPPPAARPDARAGADADLDSDSEARAWLDLRDAGLAPATTAADAAGHDVAPPVSALARGCLVVVNTGEGF